MKKSLLIILLFTFWLSNTKGQINPQNSPYLADGAYTVVSDSDMTAISVPLLFYRPQNQGNYPVFIFQLGANSFGSSVINRHTYDLFMQHLASYGFVVIIIDDSQAGFPNGGSFTASHDWFKTEYSNPNHWLSSYADPSAIVIGGHSNGGVNASALLVNRPTEINGIVFMDSYPSGGVFGIGAHDVSNYSGKVLTMAAGENDPSSNKEGWDKFASSLCKTYVNIAGLDHGGFGDYVLASQPVGSIGRADATATIRHFLVSWMLSEFKNDNQAANNLSNPTNQPSTVGEFENDCGILTSLTNNLNNEVYKIFPIPTKDVLNISSEDEIKSISLYDLQGKLIKSEVGNIKSIDISEFNKGIYILKVTTNLSILSKKVIKE